MSFLAALEFYEKLGFREFLRKERQYDTVVLLYGHGIQIEMFVDPSHPPRNTPEPLEVRHIALRGDKIEYTVEELGLLAGEILKDWMGIRFCFVVDPDGNAVELHE